MDRLSISRLVGPAKQRSRREQPIAQFESIWGRGPAFDWPANPPALARFRVASAEWHRVGEAASAEASLRRLQLMNVAERTDREGGFPAQTPSKAPVSGGPAIILNTV